MHQETRPLRVLRREAVGGWRHVREGDRALEIALLISFLPDVQRIVRDRTGLTDAFDLDLDFARSETADPQEHPPLMTALKEQLGLELRRHDGAGERDRHRPR